MVAYDPGRYLRHDEMTSFLQACAAAYPVLCQLDEIGRSAEGRAVWAVTLTNTATGAADTKPGYLVDGNTHAGEVTGGATALYTIHWLLTNYGVDPVATEILDTRAFYVVPRIAVDGVEMYLTTPHMLRSSPRRYPEPLDLPGFYTDDINGDGEILLMRIPHPDGDWKADTVDPRALARRRPEDREGVFYKLLPEGLQRDWTGPGPAPERSPRRMDFNRNYPAFWNPEGRQPGAGPYPLSEPETRALAQFVVDHPNIGAYVTFHTTGGILLRPPSYGPDDQMNEADLEVFQRIGELCTRITGCPCKSTYQAFHYPGQEALVKGADDWAYEHYGVQAYTFELWNPDLRAGGEGYAQVGFRGLRERTDSQALAEERKLLAWNDRELGGKGFVDWAPFEHPQFGTVEIGGWATKFALQNPPPGPLLVETATAAASFVFQHVLATPRLTVTLSSERLGEGLYKLSARIRNAGGLPTNVTEMAVRMQTARPIQVTLAGNVVLAAGQARQEIGHLEGRLAVAEESAAANERWVDWVVVASAGTKVRVTAATPRAGTAVGEIAL